MKKRLFSILGMICGVIICILGIVMMDEYFGYSADTYKTYGADFYTDVYRAAAMAANNVDRLGEIIALGIGYLLLAIGMTDICYFGSKLLKKNSSFNTKPNITTPSVTAEAQQSTPDEQQNNTVAPMET